VRDTELILVEGMPGTGKSTVSQFIHRQLQASGRTSAWCHEESDAHPVRLFYDANRHQSWFDYTQQAVARWESLVRQVRSQKQTIVLDAAWLQNHVRSMLIFCAEHSEIFELVDRIEAVIAPLDPVLVYLTPSDLETNFRNVVESRGERMLELWIKAHDQYPYSQRASASGYPGFIAFWKQFGEIADRAFERLGISKLRQELSDGDRTPSYASVLRFLDLAAVETSGLMPPLECLAGEYVSADDADAVCKVCVQDEHLLVRIDEPTIGVDHGPIGCFREVRLIREGPNDFYVEAWPHVVQFTEDGTGAQVGFRLSVCEPGWPQSVQEYVRQPQSK